MICARILWLGMATFAATLSLGAETPLVPRGAGRTGFTSMEPAHTGITFSNFLAEERGLTNQLYYNGSGVACGDVDGDGRADIYFASLNGDNRLYRNLGDWKFEDITARAGVRCTNQASTGAVFADVDGDGDLDLLVAGFGRGVRMFLNDGRGVFTEGTAAAGLASEHASTTIALADVDGDGDLDLYVANYRRDTFQDEPTMRFRVRTVDGSPHVVAVNDRPTTAPDLTNRFYMDARGNVQEHAEADVLYLNDGAAHFTEVLWTSGRFLDAAGRPLMAAPLDWGLTSMFRDINGDGAPDLYVCNDGESPDRIWINDGRGTFRELSPLALRETSFASMGVDFADINRDGFVDFFVADMLGHSQAARQSLMATRMPPVAPGDFARRAQYPRNTLFLNRGDGSFAEIAPLAGIEATDWSWSPVFLDVDLDGFEDLLVTTGLEKSLRDADARMEVEMLRRAGRLTREAFFEARRRMKRLDVPNYAFRNRGDLAFENVSAPWGFDSHRSSHGIALADLDGDGDLDVVVNCLNAPPLLYRNDSSAPRLAVRLRGAGRNTRGIGAKISVTGGPVAQTQEMISGGRYLSGDDPMRVFAAWSLTHRFSVTVAWRSGAVSVVSNVAPNTLVEVDEASARQLATHTNAALRSPLFVDVSARLNHRDVSASVDEFARQSTLPKKLGTFAPGVAWAGDDLLLITGSAGVTTFTNDEGSLKRADTLALRGPAAALSWNAGRTNFLAVTHSVGSSNAVSIYARTANAWVLAQTLLLGSAAPGALSAADVDGDGDLDLFVTSRAVAGQYPLPASAWLLRNSGGRFAVDESASKIFASIGVVNSSVWSDLDGDGWPELIIACEWEAIKIFRNERGTFSAWNAPVKSSGAQPSTLNDFTGLWQSVTTGDFDGDGRMDIVAGNWGRNHRFAHALPVRFYFGDLNQDGTVECFEAFRDAALNKFVPAPTWDTMAFAFPFLQQRVRGFTDYSTKSVEELFGESLGSFTQRAANTFDSVVLLNRGDHFELKPLPVEAQFAPVFGVCVADFDGDGHEDIFLAQNFSGVDRDSTPMRAGRGVLLLGNGRGEFSVSSESGVNVPGDARGAAVADFDRDGRPDLCVAQHDAEMKLFRNQSAAPGLRVRIAGNITAGVLMRAEFADGSLGAAREVRLGGGWLSQDSAVTVLAAPRRIAALRVRWPGGRERVVKVSADARAIEIAPP